MRTLLISMFVLALLVSPADARWRRRRSNTDQTYSTYSYGHHGYASDQDACQAEAEFMAANGISGHVWTNIGGFEGFGVGMSPACATCVPGYGMTLTGDAAVQGAGGLWYRVCSWR